MKILVTQSNSFLGKNLVENPKNVRDGKNRTRPNIHIEEIYEYDLGDEDKLEEYCSKCDFVFNLARINRPTKGEDFYNGNFGFATKLLDALKKFNNKAPIMLSSSFLAVPGSLSFFSPSSSKLISSFVIWNNSFFFITLASFPSESSLTD